MNDNKLAVPIAIVVAGALVAGAIYFTQKDAPAAAINNRQPQKAVNENIDLTPITDVDHIQGNPKAPVIIVEYSDFECPFCKVFHNTVTRIMDEYGPSGKVAWAYRHFPLDIHPKAYNEAIASECAATLGGADVFWKFVNNIFAVTPSNNGLDPAQLPVIAKKIGLDQKAFNDCLAKQTPKAKVDADMASAVKAGVQGTPFSIIVYTDNGTTQYQVVNGAQPYSYVKAVIDTILDGKK